MAQTKTTSESDDSKPQVVALQPITEAVVTVPIIGKTPVIPHRWSEKAIRMMAAKQSGKAVRQPKEPKDPEQEARDSCYWLGDKGAMPAVAFKAAMVGACRFYEGISMTQAKLLFYVEGEGSGQLVPLEGAAEMRQDTPRNTGGVADLRYRMQFWPWAAVLTVRFVPSMIDTGSVFALVHAAGRGGVGDWRPSSPKSSTGVYGQFRVEGMD